MDDVENITQFPKDLVEWSGHHSGGVKRLFDPESGRPGKALLRTHLIAKLESWAKDIAIGTSGTPRILLLVGGPGNGKTEAIEHTAKCLDDALSASGRLIQRLTDAFHPEEGKKVPRIVQVNAGPLAMQPRTLYLSIVQDASVTAGQEGKLASKLLIEELSQTVAGPESNIYLCCVNRGVLDDALIQAIDHGPDDARLMLETITRSVSLSSSAPQCWPLDGVPSVAVWPMDVESLLLPPDGSPTSPAASLLSFATEPSLWPAEDGCRAGDKCPFCHGQKLLRREGHSDALLRILRWFELASGKRWSFRDLFSLLSYLLAGHQHAVKGQKTTPCEWAAHLLELDTSSHTNREPGRNELTAFLRLTTSSYQHALFHRWDTSAAPMLRRDMQDLGLADSEETRTIRGLQAFLHDRKSTYLPTTISSLLIELADLLDPALANPELEVPVSGRTTVRLAELDIRFSRSILAGIEFIKKYKVMSPNEMELLRRLGAADSILSAPSIRRKRPTAANRIQRTLRDFACRLVRRSICTRSASVADREILSSFQKVVEDEKGNQVHDVAQKVRQLLNSHNEFRVSLTTTFGQPQPPNQRQAILVVPPQQVKPLPLEKKGRPRSPICFLKVGSVKSSDPVALTYDLFKAVKELERGMSPASLPRTVVALLDTTRAKLAGHIVRNSEILDNAKIKIGSDGTEISMSWNGFQAVVGGRTE